MARLYSQIFYRGEKPYFAFKTRCVKNPTSSTNWWSKNGKKALSVLSLKSLPVDKVTG